MQKINRETKIKKKISERIENEKLELKKLILKASAELFLEKGYEKFSLRQVAEKIGYSATTIYLYFKDKDELLFSVILAGFEIFHKMLIEAAHNEKEDLEKVMATGRAYIKFGLEYPLYYQVMFMQRADFLFKNNPKDDESVISSFSVLKELVKKLLDKGVFKQKEHAEELYSNILWANLHGIISLYIVMPQMYNTEMVLEIAETSISMCIDGLKK